MNTSPNYFIPNFDHDLTQGQTSTPSASKKKGRSLVSFVHNPRKFLAAVMGVALVSVLGIGLVAGMQSLNQSTEKRSQASDSPPSEGTVYYKSSSGSAVNTIAMSNPTESVQLNIVAGRSLIAYALCLGYDSTKINISFAPNSQYRLAPGDLGSGVNATKVLMAYVNSSAGSGVNGSQSFGTLTIQKQSGFSGSTNINIVSCPGGGQAVTNDGQLLGLSGGNLTVITSPGPNIPSPAPEILGKGKVYSCPETFCTEAVTPDVPKWRPATIDASGVANIPADTKKVRYIDVPGNTASNNRTWMARTFAQDKNGTEIHRFNSNQVEVEVIDIKADQWPLTVATNFVYDDNGIRYSCSPRPSTFGAGKQEYAWYPLNQPTSATSIAGGCTNLTKVIVQKDGTTPPTPTPTPDSSACSCDPFQTYFTSNPVETPKECSSPDSRNGWTKRATRENDSRVKVEYFACDNGGVPPPGNCNCAVERTGVNGDMTTEQECLGVNNVLASCFMPFSTSSEDVSGKYWKWENNRCVVYNFKCGTSSPPTPTRTPTPTPTRTSTPTPTPTPVMDVMVEFVNAPSSVTVNESFNLEMKVTNVGQVATPLFSSSDRLMRVRLLRKNNDTTSYTTIRENLRLEPLEVNQSYSYVFTGLSEIDVNSQPTYQLRLSLPGESGYHLENNLNEKRITVQADPARTVLSATNTPTPSPTRTPTPTATRSPSPTATLAPTRTPTPGQNLSCNAVNLRLRGIVWKEKSKDPNTGAITYEKFADAIDIVRLQNSSDNPNSYDATVRTYGYGMYDFGGIIYGKYRMDFKDITGYVKKSTQFVTVCPGNSCPADGTICEVDIFYNKL